MSSKRSRKKQLKALPEKVQGADFVRPENTLDLTVETTKKLNELIDYLKEREGEHTEH